MRWDPATSSPSANRLAVAENERAFLQARPPTQTKQSLIEEMTYNLSTEVPARDFFGAPFE